MKIIVTTGVRRTGSTWQYNVIRLALIEAGYNVYGNGEYDSKIDVDYYVIHIHGYDYELRKKAWKIFTTVRDFEGIKGSLKRMGWEKSDKNIMKYIKEWNKWWRYACHVTNFTEIKTAEQWQIICIISELGVNADYREVQKELHKLKPPKEGEYAKTGGYHTTTLLHPNHYE